MHVPVSWQSGWPKMVGLPRKVKSALAELLLVCTYSYGGGAFTSKLKVFRLSQ